jgi:hypothetical protein
LVGVAVGVLVCGGVAVLVGVGVSQAIMQVLSVTDMGAVSAESIQAILVMQRPAAHA